MASDERSGLMMRERAQVQVQQDKTGKSHSLRRLKWGIVFAGLYLLVCIPCTAAYLVDRHEYSIPLFTVYLASFPMHYLIFQVLRPFTLPLERLPYGEALGLSILLALTALLYFLIGQSAGWVVQSLAARARSRRERSQPPPAKPET